MVDAHWPYSSRDELDAEAALRTAWVAEVIAETFDVYSPLPEDLLPVLLAMRKAAQDQVDDLVLLCRREGHSWGRIGKWLGVSRQAAQKRYGSIDPWDAVAGNT